MYDANAPILGPHTEAYAIRQQAGPSSGEHRHRYKHHETVAAHKAQCPLLLPGYKYYEAYAYT